MDIAVPVAQKMAKIIKQIVVETLINGAEFDNLHTVYKNLL